MQILLDDLGCKSLKQKVSEITRTKQKIEAKLIQIAIEPILPKSIKIENFQCDCSSDALV